MESSKRMASINLEAEVAPGSREANTLATSRTWPLRVDWETVVRQSPAGAGAGADAEVPDPFSGLVAGVDAADDILRILLEDLLRSTCTLPVFADRTGRHAAMKACAVALCWPVLAPALRSSDGMQTFRLLRSASE